MTQTIKVTCIQSYPVSSDVVGVGEFESADMGLDPWKNAIHAAAIASGFGTEVLREFVLQWAAELEMDTWK